MKVPESGEELVDGGENNAGERKGYRAVDVFCAEVVLGLVLPRFADDEVDV